MPDLGRWLTVTGMAPDRQERRRIVIDGSNIATEGRTVPSLAQLDEAIRSFLEEYQGFASDDVTVVVDATFGHRIDASELPAFESAIDHGEVITPPAGAVGRGDGFILRIAEKSGALVLSNDSFQEFHAERPWLFEPGRLIGGKPVPGVGWVFTPRTPVRGVKSRAATTRSRRDGTADTDAGDPAVTKSAAKKKAAKASKSTSTTKTTTTAKATKSTKSDGATKSGGATKSDGATKTAKTAKAIKAQKAGKEEKPTKTGASSTKAAKTAKMATATKPEKAKKASKGGASEPGDATAPPKAPGSRAVGSQPPNSATAKGRAPKGRAAPGSADAATEVTPGGRAPKTGKAGSAAKGAKRAKTAKAANADQGAKADQIARAAPDSGNGQAPGVGAADAASALNDPVTFLNFVASHPVGSTFDGTVASFTSHGAHIDVDGMLCHVPLRGLGDPPPTRARQVLSKGETRPFVLVSLDAARRRAALALPGLGRD